VRTLLVQAEKPLTSSTDPLYLRRLRDGTDLSDNIQLFQRHRHRDLYVSLLQEPCLRCALRPHCPPSPQGALYPWNSLPYSHHSCVRAGCGFYVSLEAMSRRLYVALPFYVSLRALSTRAHTLRPHSALPRSSALRPVPLGSLHGPGVPNGARERASDARKLDWGPPLCLVSCLLYKIVIN